MTAPKNPNAANEGSNKTFVLAIVAIVVIGIAAVAFLATSRDSQLANQTADVTVTGEPLPPYTGTGVAASDDASFGMVAPELVGEDFSGDEIRIEADGTPKAVYFLAHHCPHCQAEVPTVQALIDSGQVPEGLDLYAVSTSVDATRGNFPPEAWLESENWTVPTMKDNDESDALAAFGGRSFPYVVILDADHEVVTRSSGELPEDVTLSLWQLGLLGNAPDAGTDSEASEEAADDADAEDGEGDSSEE